MKLENKTLVFSEIMTLYSLPMLMVLHILASPNAILKAIKKKDFFLFQSQSQSGIIFNYLLSKKIKNANIQDY